MTAARASPNLDFLRATAVLLVLADHVLSFVGVKATPYYSPKLGLLGVLLFFVHTSLVLMFSLERQHEKTGPANAFRIFMLRRFFRVYPISMLLVTFIYVLRIPNYFLEVRNIVPAHYDALTYLSSLLLVQNLTDRESVIGVLWSLPYEMQMYLFLPGLFLFARKVRSAGTLLLCWLVSVIFAVAQAEVSFLPSLLRYLPCFLPGIIAYRLSMDTDRTSRRWPFWLFPTMLFTCAAVYSVLQHHFERGAAFAGMPICLLVGSTLPFFADPGDGMIRRISNLIARYSYGIYLTQTFCLWLAFMKLSALPVVAQWMLFTVAVAGLPVLLYHTVEAPMIAVGNRFIAARLGRHPAPRLLSEFAPDSGPAL